MHFSEAGAGAPLEVAYTRQENDRFARIVERTYEGTLDCPILTGIRTGADSLAAHRGTGPFDPRWWRLFQRDGRDAGILLMTHHPERRACEVTYIGVVPEARRRGLGRAMMQAAFVQAREAACDHVEVAVDAANSHAIALYRQLGFHPVRQYAVHLRLRGEIKD